MQANTPDAVDPPAGRRAWVVNLLLALLVGGHLLAIAIGREAWPLSHYPMYAGVQGPRFSFTGIYGVTDEGEVPLFGGEYWTPFDGSRLASALSKLRDGERASSALAYLFRRYEQRRAAGQHDGPPVHALRVVRVEWSLRPGAANARVPDARTLLHAYPEEGGR